MPTWTAADGSVINYEIHAVGTEEKPTLLLLPGLLGAISTQWRSFLPSLLPEFRIVLSDLRGHGRSTNTTNELNPDTMMFDLSGLLDHLNVDRVHISGYSLGGYLALMLALKESTRIVSVMMHATKFYWTQEAAKVMYQQLDPDTMAQKVPAYADQLVQEHGARQWRILVRQAADQANHLVENGITERMASHTQSPVLVSVGDRDELVPINESLRLTRQFYKGELIVLPGVRHPFQSIRPIPFIPTMVNFHKNTI